MTLISEQVQTSRQINSRQTRAADRSNIYKRAAAKQRRQQGRVITVANELELKYVVSSESEGGGSLKLYVACTEALLGHLRSNTHYTGRGVFFFGSRFQRDLCVSSEVNQKSSLFKASPDQSLSITKRLFFNRSLNQICLTFSCSLLTLSAIWILWDYFSFGLAE